MFKKNLFSLGLAAVLLSHAAAWAKGGWLQQESEHFTVIYLEPHGYLVPHILRSAESSLERLSELFDYRPSEKILITTLDFSDHGTASATTTPHNRIWLEIEPFELGYENTLVPRPHPVAHEPRARAHRRQRPGGDVRGF